MGWKKLGEFVALANKLYGTKFVDTAPRNESFRNLHEVYGIESLNNKVPVTPQNRIDTFKKIIADVVKEEIKKR